MNAVARLEDEKQKAPERSAFCDSRADPGNAFR
jgi:hypothetical protein